MENTVYLIQPVELAGTQHYVLGSGLFRRSGTRIIILMESSEPEKVKDYILARYKEWFIVKEDHVEGEVSPLRDIFYQAFVTYEHSRPVKMDVDEPILFKYLRPN
jgi:hypothetical protein